MPAISAIGGADESERLVGRLAVGPLGIAIVATRRGWHAYGSLLQAEDDSLRATLENTIQRSQEEVRVREGSENDRRVSEDRYRGMFDNALAGMFQCAAGESFTLSNSAFAAMLGYASPGDVCHASLATHLPLGSAEPGSESAAVDELLLGHGATLLRRCDGSNVADASHVRPIASKSGTGTGCATPVKR